MELAFVYRVNVRRERAPEVRECAERLKVALSAHAPYYINLDSSDADKVERSRQRLLSAARIGWLCGADRVVFHAGWRGEHSPEHTYEAVRAQVQELAGMLRDEGVSIRLMPETTGKPAQFGDLDELLALAHDVPGVEPCLDFAHLHARHGSMNTEEEFEQVLRRVELVLGPQAMHRLHIHVSGIEYGGRGERRHLLLGASDFNYTGLLRVLARLGVSGRVICESPENDRDAVRLQQAWQEITAQG